MTLHHTILRMTSLAACLAWAPAAYADLRVSFFEGAPKDRFVIANTGACAISAASVVIDLSQSQGGLIFDVTAAGQGVEVFQPFEVVQGAASLARLPTVLDGQTKVSLDIAQLASNASIAFTIDVDDTIGQRAITVSGSEFAGVTTSYTGRGAPVTATFVSGSEAVIPIATCTS